MPYTKTLILATSLMCWVGDDLWLVVVSIYCFDIIGIYYFNWITRQFKFSQYILDYIDTSDELYIVNRQGKKKDN
jgi:hypothetical protein